MSSAETRHSLFEKLQRSAPRYVAPIVAVCACSLVMPVVSGLVLIDDETRPDWHKLLFRDQFGDAASRVSWERLGLALADLSEGLANLHALGIAHGDPYPYNAILTTGGDAVWIDFNSCLPADPLTRAIDLVGFVAFTLTASLARSGRWAPTTLEAIVQQLSHGSVETLLTDLASILREGRSLTPELPGATDVLHRCLSALSERGDLLGDVARQITASGLVNYFREYGYLRNVAVGRERLLQAEQARHLVVEREVHRTAEIRRAEEIGALKSWVAELERGKAWLDEQRVNWQGRAEGLERELESARVLVADLQHLDEENAVLTEELRRAEMLIASLQPVVAETEELRKAVERSRRAKQSLDALSKEIDGLQVALEEARRELSLIQGSSAWSLMQVLWRLRRRIAPPGGVRARILGGVARRLRLKRPPAHGAPVAASATAGQTPVSTTDDVYVLLNQQRDRIREARTRRAGNLEQ